jgi:hypothetical protein
MWFVNRGSWVVGREGAINSTGRRTFSSVISIEDFSPSRGICGSTNSVTMGFDDWSTNWFEWLPIVVVAVLASWAVGYKGFSELRSDETFLLVMSAGLLLIGFRRYWRFGGFWIGALVGLIVNAFVLWLLFDVCFRSVRHLGRGPGALVLTLQVVIWVGVYGIVRSFHNRRPRYNKTKSELGDRLDAREESRP